MSEAIGGQNRPLTIDEQLCLCKSRSFPLLEGQECDSPWAEPLSRALFQWAGFNLGAGTKNRSFEGTFFTENSRGGL
jgi:hypothetical protein